MSCRKASLLVVCITFLLCQSLAFSNPHQLSTLSTCIGERRYNNQELLKLRGGERYTTTRTTENEYGSDIDNGSKREEEKDGADGETVQWLLDQVGLYQCRLAVLSDALSSRGFAIRSAIPRPPGLICAKSTHEYPLHCRVYIEPAEGTKVIAPCKCKGSQRWIALSALNQQRRKDAEKWKQCPTCQTPIDYSIYEEKMGSLYRVLSWVLNHRQSSRLFLGCSVAMLTLLAFYQLRWLFIRVFVSGFFWRRYHIVTPVLYAPLPLKIVVLQMARKWIGEGFLQLEERIRDYITDLESAVLEKCVPETMSAEEADNSDSSI